MNDAFASALLDPERERPDGLHDATGGSAGRRFDVYRNNVTVSLIDALMTGFPILTRLLGEENMRGICRLFARSHPPSSPLMMFYGAEMPAFLEDMEQLAHLPYLADTARLELAMRRSYHAADATPVVPEELSELPPEALMRATFALAPSVILVRSNWPIHAIWRFNTEDGAPKPAPGAQDVIVTRPEFDPTCDLLPPGAATWVAALQDGARFGDALEAAQTEAPAFDLTTSLALLLQGGAITSIFPEGRSAP